MHALLIGGTGPTGPDIVTALVARGYDVTVLHRGVHESTDAVLSEVEHIHADPHFAEPLREALGTRTFDIVIATYGRQRVNAEVCAGRCDRFVAVGGNPVHRGMLDRRSSFPSGMKILATEDGAVADGSGSSRDRFARRVAEAESSVLAAHARGDFCATYVRYPIVYGRRAWLAFERGIVRRLLDGRRRLLMPDGGLGINTRCADVNAASIIARVVDHPAPSAGQVYHAADEDQFSLAQWTELIAGTLGLDAELVSVPLDLARPVWDLLPVGHLGSPHTLVDASKARRDLGYRDEVSASEALASVVEHLAAAPETQNVQYDAAAEDAVLSTLDRARDQLSRSLNWRVEDEDFHHPYDHPTAPLTDR